MKTRKTKTESILGSFFSKVEKALSVRTKVVVGLAVLAITGVAVTSLIPENDVTANSVKILSTSVRSGGSGVIYRSSPSGTEILTNAHVCSVIKEGGVVSAYGSTSLIVGYKESTQHDLCMIKVNKNLGINSKIATTPPTAYYEKALISGHPRLLPNVVTSGHFSGTQIISVLTRVKKCEIKEGDDVCALFRYIPVIRQFESTLVTATIMPGSSGSGVYNENMELVGLAFAGSGNLGYAWTVPFEYLTNFLYKEQYTLEYKIPETTKEYSFGLRNSGKNEPEVLSVREEAEGFKSILEVCSTKEANLPAKFENLCKIAKRDLLWRK